MPDDGPESVELGLYLTVERFEFHLFCEQPYTAHPFAKANAREDVLEEVPRSKHIGNSCRRAVTEWQTSPNRCANVTSHCLSLASGT